MSNSNTTINTCANEVPLGNMTSVGNKVIGEMPNGQMMGVATAITTGMTITEMPLGNMTEVGNMAIGEMSSGQIMRVTMAGMTITEMPLGDMTGIGNKAIGKMPSGQMMGAATVTKAERIAEMPLGNMISADSSGGGMSGEFPRLSIEITGEWHLLLSPISLKSGAQS